MKTIVLINGIARSGKDTFAEMLVPHLCGTDKTGFILPNAFGTFIGIILNDIYYYG